MKSKKSSEIHNATWDASLSATYRAIEKATLKVSLSAVRAGTWDAIFNATALPTYNTAIMAMGEFVNEI